jgi:hypothetical protein
LEQVEVAEAVLGVLNGYTAWSDLEIGHG